MCTFLVLTEQRKLECPLVYKTRCNALSAELSIAWGVEDAFKADQLLTNDSRWDIKPAWRDKNTTTIFADLSIIVAPATDYVRWYLSCEKIHYIPFKQRGDLVDDPWNKIPKLFLLPRIGL